MSFTIINPQSLGAPSGYNNGMLAPADGRLLFVAGQTPRDDTGGIVEGGFVAQFSQALRNVLRVVCAAGGRPTDIGRMTVFVTELPVYLNSLQPLGQAYREAMGAHYPAMSLVEVTALVDAGAMVEVEATAVIPQHPQESP